MDIWNSSPEVQDFEWSAAELFNPHQSILERMTLVVYLAIEDHLKVCQSKNTKWSWNEYESRYAEIVMGSGRDDP